MTEPDVQIRRADYLNLDQKKIKQEIMEELFNVLRTKLMQNSAILDSASTTDIVFSCLVMFVREILLDMIMSTGQPVEYMPGIIHQFNSAINECVTEAIIKLVKNEGEVH